MATNLKFDEALARHQQGDLVGAEHDYLALLEAESDNADLLHLLAILYGQKSQFKKALPYIEKALSLNPNSSSFHNSMGNIQKNLKDYDAAIKHYQNALSMDANSVSANNNLASIFVRQEKYKKAVEYYRAAIAIKSDFVDARYNLALVLLQQNNEPEALQELKQCLTIDEKYYPAMARLGQIELHHERYDLAQEWLEKSVKLNPDDADAQANLGAVLTKLGDLKNAEEHSKKSIELDPKHHEAHFNLGCIYLTLQNPQSALSHFLQVLTTHPTPEAYFNVGVIYMYQDHHKEAISYLTQAVKMDSRYVDAHMNLGVTYLKMDHNTDAIKHFESVLKISPNNKEVKYILAALKGEHAPDKAPEEYISHLFDQYAPYYEKHLLEYLEYQTPQVMLDVLEQIFENNFEDLVIVDLGCGTGLTGEIFKPYAKRLVGIDLSSNMIALANKKNIYDDLHIADIHVTLKSIDDADLILAGDVLSYLGDLSPTFAAVRKALKPGGYFAFTVERAANDVQDFELQKTARYSHSKAYIEKTAKAHQFTLTEIKTITLRMQKNKPVVGFLIVLS